MRCFEQLIRSKFLVNAAAELERARSRIVESQEDVDHPPLRSYGFDKVTRKKEYQSYLDYYDLRSLMSEVVQAKHDMLYYVQINHLIFAFSSDKDLVKDTIRYSYNINGDLPIYSSRHRIGGVTFHTVLIDVRFSFEPMSPN